MLTLSPQLPKRGKNKYWYMYIVVPVSVLLLATVVFYWWKGLSDTPEAWLARANTYAANNEFGDALNAYLKSDQQQPNNPVTLTGIAQCYSKINQLQKAMSYTVDALHIKPDHIPALLLQSDLFRVLGDNHNALLIALQAIHIDPNTSDHYLKAASLYRLENDYTSAIAMYQKALSLDPNNVQAKGGLAQSEDLYERQASLERTWSENQGVYEPDQISTVPNFNQPQKPSSPSEETISPEDVGNR